MTIFQKNIVAMCVSILVLCVCLNAFADDSICARVKIEIQQELTLERQAFEAHMRISNGLSDMPLENVGVEVKFSDAEGNSVPASSDPDNTEALFFIALDNMENIADVNGAGFVSPSTVADIRWLIIPAPGAAEGLPDGTLYYIGATLTYVVKGKENITEVSPDYIFVKPMPELALDYFLPVDVYGDDAFTPEVEPPVPFSLGVRVANNGQGVARNVSIDSADLEIVENEQDLLIDFVIEFTEVNGQEASETLHVELGDISAGGCGMARWILSCSLSGRFVEFDARFSHANELGGELTSLLTDVNTHFLVHDVQVDIFGRDTIRDFLAKDGDIYRVYESENVDTEVVDQSAPATLTFNSTIGSEHYYSLTIPAGQGFIFAGVTDPLGGEKVIKSIMRSDGKTILPANGWLSKTRTGSDPWKYFFNLFDVNPTGSYTVVFDDIGSLPQPPVLQYIPDRSRDEGQQLSFIVGASDPNGTIPTLSAAPLPAGAKFVDQGDGSAIFDWTPSMGQAGKYRITFVASDGALEDSQLVTLTIGGTPDTDGDGMADSWEMKFFGNLDRDGTGHFDDDGFTDKEEHDACSNPASTLSYPEITMRNLNKGFNLIGIPSGADCKPDLNEWLPVFGNSGEIEKVLVFDSEENTFVTLIPEDEFNPVFMRQGGEGLIIYAGMEKEITFTSVDCSGFDLMQGINLIGFACPPADYSSFDLLNDLGNDDVYSIQRYAVETGMFETAGFDANDQPSGIDFSIAAGEGYFVYMKQEVLDFGF